MNEQTFVLDLGTSKAAILAVEADVVGHPHISAAATVPSKGVRRGQIVDVDLAAVTIDEACRKLQHLCGREVGTLALGLGGSHFDCTTAQGFVPVFPAGRAITPEDILQVLNHSRQVPVSPGREQIHALPREFRVDGKRGVREPVGTSGAKLEVLTSIVTSRSSDLADAERATELAGRRLDQIVPVHIAAGLGVTTDADREAGVAVIDLGAGSMTIGIFTSGGLAALASVPIGAQSVTNDIAALLKTSTDEAERLKTHHGAALADDAGDNESVQVLQEDHDRPRDMKRRVLCEIIECRARELARLAADAVVGTGVAHEVRAVVVTGGGSLLKGSGNVFAEAFDGVPLSVRTPQIGGAYGPVVSKPGMAASLGLARFVFAASASDLVPATGDSGGWKQRVRSLLSVIGGRN